MSRAKAIRQSQIQKPLKYLDDKFVIRLLNSWVIQNEKVADFNELPPNKQKARRYFEDQMRIAMCIAKNKPYITAKPQKPEKPYKGFYEFVHKMRTAATDRSYKYLFARKLHIGSKIAMIDGTYTARNIVLYDEKGGELDLIKGDLVYHLKWGINVPKFYYLPNMDMGNHHMEEGMNSNNEDLESMKVAVSKMKMTIYDMKTLGLDTSGLEEKLAEMEEDIKRKECKK